MVVVSIFTKKRNFGFFRTKSWSSGQISRKTGIPFFIALNHDRRVKFHEKRNVGFIRAKSCPSAQTHKIPEFRFFFTPNHGRRVKFNEKT
jgi:hypothetical protein